MRKALKNAAAILLCVIMALGAGIRYFPESEVYAAYTYTDENGFRLKKYDNGELCLIHYNGTDAVVEIPEGVTSIEYGAFAGCSGVLGVIIPTTVTSISTSVMSRFIFEGCSGLQYIAVREGNPIYDSREDCNAIIESSSNKLLLGCKGTLIPKSVTSIGEVAFYGCSGLSNIKIPESVTSIGGAAFYGCSGLKNITISEGVTSIESSAFRDCSSLSSITIPKSVTSIYERAFLGCSSLSKIEVEEGNPVYDSRENCNAIIESESNELIVGSNTTVIPESVTRIGDYAFYEGGLTSIRIPESVTEIGHDTFYGSSLKNITISEGVTSIGDWAFNGCASLDRIEVEEGNTVYDSRENCNAIIKSESNELIVGSNTTVIPESVTSIDLDAFNGRSGLTSIRIPKSVTKVAGPAIVPARNLFTGCINLSRIEVEEGNPVYDSRENCNAIIESESNEVIVGCKGTVIPESVTSIGDYAFYGGGLTSFVIPHSITSIGILAFAENHELISLVIPDSVTEVRAYDQGCICWFCEKVTVYLEDGAAVEGSAVYDHLTAYGQPFRLLSECEQNILTSETIGQMAEENKMQDTVFHTDDGLTVTFKKGTLEQENGNGFYDFGAEMTGEYASLPDSTFTEGEFAFRIDYNTKGPMPGETLITMPAGEEWSGKKLYYYEILEDGSYSYIGRSTVTADGNYTIQQQHGGSYVAVTSVPENLGDCDGEDGITAKDALAILKYSLGLSQENFAMELADCDGEDGITSKDALAVLKYALGILDKLE